MGLSRSGIDIDLDDEELLNAASDTIGAIVDQNLEDFREKTDESLGVHKLMSTQFGASNGRSHAKPEAYAKETPLPFSRIPLGAGTVEILYRAPALLPTGSVPAQKTNSVPPNYPDGKLSQPPPSWDKHP